MRRAAVGFASNAAVRRYSRHARTSRSRTRVAVCASRSPEQVAAELLASGRIDEECAKWIGAMSHERAARVSNALLGRSARLVLLLKCSSMDRFDAAAVLRSGDAFGVQSAYCAIGDRDRPGFYSLDTGNLRDDTGLNMSRQIRRATAGVEKWLTVHEDPHVEPLLRNLRDQGFQIVSLRDEDAAMDATRSRTAIDRLALSGHTALCLGLSAEEEASIADHAICVPTLGVGSGLLPAAAASVTLSVLSERMRELVGDQAYFMPPEQSRDICTAWRHADAPANFKRTRYQWAGLSGDTEAAVLEGGLFSEPGWQVDSLRSKLDAFQRDGSPAQDILAYLLRRRNAPLSAVTYSRRRDALSQMLIGTHVLLALGPAGDAEHRILRACIKNVVARVHNAFAPSFDPLGIPLAPFAPESQRAIEEANRKVCEFVLGAVPQLCRAIDFAGDPFASLAAFQDVDVVRVLLSVLRFEDGRLTDAVAHRMRHRLQALAPQPVPYGIYHGETWGQVLDSSSTSAGGSRGREAARSEIRLLELVLRLHQSGTAAAQLHTCVWERVAKGRNGGRLKSPRLLCFEAVVVETAEDEMKSGASEEEALVMVACELWLSLACIRLSLTPQLLEELRDLPDESQQVLPRDDGQQ